MSDRVPHALAPPERAIHHILLRLWQDLLGVSPIGIHDSFFDLGGQSLQAARLIERIELICGRRISLGEFAAHPTIAALAVALDDRGDAPVRSPLVPIQASGTRRPFYFLHGDFGGGFYCWRMLPGIDPDQPFFALHPHGLDGGWIPHTIQAMAASHLRRLRAFQPEGPYLLGGYCNGGLVAYEMARRLQAQGQKVDLLVMVATAEASALPRWGRGIVARYGELAGRSPDEQARSFARLRYYGRRLGDVSNRADVAGIGLIPWKVGRRLLVRVWEPRPGLVRPVPASASGRRQVVSDVYHWAFDGYRLRPYAGRVTLLWPRDEPIGRDPTAAWRRAAADADVHHVPGTHDTCITRHASALAKRLWACVDEAQARGDPR